MTTLYATLIWLLSLFGFGAGECPQVTASPTCEPSAARAEANKDADPASAAPSPWMAGSSADDPISNGF